MVRFPVPMLYMTTFCNSVSRIPDTFFWYPPAPDMHMVIAQYCRDNTQTYNMKINLKKERNSYYYRLCMEEGLWNENRVKIKKRFSRI